MRKRVEHAFDRIFRIVVVFSFSFMVNLFILLFMLPYLLYPFFFRIWQKQK